MILCCIFKAASWRLRDSRSENRIADLEGMCCKIAIFDPHPEPINAFIKAAEAFIVIRCRSLATLRSISVAGRGHAG
jgi:hypothetical protein